MSGLHRDYASTYKAVHNGAQFLLSVLHEIEKVPYVQTAAVHDGEELRSGEATLQIGFPLHESRRGLRYNRLR